MIRSSHKIPFNKPYMTGKELKYIQGAHRNNHLSGDGEYTNKCHKIIQELSGSQKALLTHSCTSALEMAAILLDIRPGDEIIMPSFTFVSTANAFVLRGGVPVFIDIKPDTLNIDEKIIREAVTERTKAIVPVHYAGISCEMNKITEIADDYNLIIIEDAAQAILSKYEGASLGTIGTFGAYSFHETKNVISGEGGALLINDTKYFADAEIIREKGTDRSQFMRGETDKYTWRGIGSSYLPGEIIAAFLLAQLEDADNITKRRLSAWNYYHDNLGHLEKSGMVRRPVVPDNCQHNAHMYYLLLNKGINRKTILDKYKQSNINAISHYVPLHLSPGGKKFGRVHGRMDITNYVADKIIRLPLWVSISRDEQDAVINVLENI